MKIQAEKLIGILGQSETVKEILTCAPSLNMPNWYLGAGCVAQTFWNKAHGFDLAHGIKDYDLVYYDASDISCEGEDVYIKGAEGLVNNIGVKTEVRNEARVHLWYEAHFGRKIDQYISCENAISTWPTTATCIGLRFENGYYFVYAPYGLDDLLNLVVRPNKTQITKEIYQRKVDRWLGIWPKLEILTWEEGITVADIRYHEPLRVKL